MLFSLAAMALAGCSTTPESTAISRAEPSISTIVCDSYIVMDMCVQDLSGDATVDMVYFSDTREIFMYQDGRQDMVAEVMPLHRCAVPLSPRMQTTTNRILHRNNLSLTEELDITRQLIASYVAAKPEIDACNARYENTDDSVAYDDDFLSDEADWGED